MSRLVAAIAFVFFATATAQGQGQGQAQGQGQTQGQGQSQGQGQNQVDFNTIFKVMKIDQCNMKCVEPLKAALEKSMQMSSVYTGLEELCSAYGQLQDCQKKSHCVTTAPLMKLLVSGVEDWCKPETQQAFKKNQTCIQGSADPIAQSCDQKCQFVKGLAQYSHDPEVQKGTNPWAPLSQLGPVCSGFQCYFQCFSSGLNEKCDGAGSAITKSMLQPFYQLTAFGQKLSPNIQKLVASKTAPQCTKLTNKQVLDSLSQSSGSGDQSGSQQGASGQQQGAAGQQQGAAGQQQQGQQQGQQGAQQGAGDQQGQQQGGQQGQQQGGQQGQQQQAGQQDQQGQQQAGQQESQRSKTQQRRR